jgi:hypothetical protein
MRRNKLQNKKVKTLTKSKTTSCLVNLRKERRVRKHRGPKIYRRQMMK